MLPFDYGQHNALIWACYAASLALVAGLALFVRGEARRVRRGLAMAEAEHPAREAAEL